MIDRVFHAIFKAWPANPASIIPVLFITSSCAAMAARIFFFSNNDRTKFYLLLQEGIKRFGHRIHAFCLMTNHIHLVIQIGDIPLSKIMQNVTFRYTRYINANCKDLLYIEGCEWFLKVQD